MTATTDTIRVIHVDDNPDLADVAATFLEREEDRLTVETATSADEGLEYLAEHDIDCIVSDYNMPGRNGIEFLENVRETDSDIPFILYTGKGSEAVASDAISAGVTDYLQKETGTSQYAVLANRITNAVEQYRTRLERRRRRERRDRQGDALLELTTDDAMTAGDFETALERITETAAGVLEVPRVNVWLFDDENETLRCADHFDQSADVHESGMELVAENYPAYFEALESSRSIAATDAFEDPRTTELAEYLEEHDVRALLDATIRSEGAVIGMVCHEHVGGAREWTDDEIAFASDIAELVHRALRNRERVEHTYELETARARFEALTENTTRAVVTIDEGNTVCYANDAVEDVFGYAPEELVGESLLTIVPERYRDDHSEAVTRYLWEGTKRLDWEWIEMPGLHRDGREIPLGISFGEVTVEGEHRFTAVIHDIEERKQREEELETAHRRFDAVFNNPVTFMGILEPDGTVTNANETALEFVDRSLDDVSGVPFWDTPWWDHSETLQDDLRSWIERAAAGEVVRYEANHYAPGGERVALDGVLHPIRDDEGTVISILAAGRDISQREEHEEAINALHGATRGLIAAGSENEIADLIAETAADLLDLSHTGIHLYEADCDALVPAAWTDTVSETIGQPPALGRDSLAWHVFEGGETRMFDDLSTHTETHNPETPLESELIVPLGQYGVAIVGSERRNAFDQKDRQLIELLCGNATAALDRVTRERELERKNDRLEEFASVVSHDLRNPLNVAEGRLELAAEECDSEHLETVEMAHERMQALIEDLLVLSRDEEDIAECERIDLAGIVEGCWANVETFDATLITEVKRTIRANESRLKQLFENLLRNAIEHGGEDVLVTIGELDDGFYLEDTGPGIPAEDREAVFDAGYSTLAEGTGFGLSIVAQVAESHGWEIRLTEGAEGGTRFEITGVGGCCERETPH